MKFIGVANLRETERNATSSCYDPRLMVLADGYAWVAHVHEVEQYPDKGIEISTWDFGPNLIASAQARTFDEALAMMKARRQAAE